MEYHKHDFDAPPRPRRWRNKAILGAVVIVGLTLLVWQPWHSPESTMIPELGSSLGARQTQTMRSRVQQHDVRPNLRPVSAPQRRTLARPSATKNLGIDHFFASSPPKSTPNKAHLFPSRPSASPRRRVQGNAWRIDPFFGPIPSVRIGMGTMRDLADVFDELEAELRERQEDEIAARRRVRDIYNEELARLRKEREERKAEQSTTRQRNRAAVQANAATDEDSRGTTNSFPEATRQEIAINPSDATPSLRQWQIPPLSLRETPGTYEYRVDVQGMNLDDLQLTMQDNVVVVAGRKMISSADSGGYYSSEFKRSFTLPRDADLGSVRAEEAEEGKLMLTAEKIRPIPETAVASRREVPIERLPGDESVDNDEQSKESTVVSAKGGVGDDSGIVKNEVQTNDATSIAAMPSEEDRPAAS